MTVESWRKSEGSPKTGTKPKEWAIIKGIEPKEANRLAAKLSEAGVDCWEISLRRTDGKANLGVRLAPSQVEAALR